MAIQYSGSIVTSTLSGDIDSIINGLQELLSNAGWTTVNTYNSVGTMFVISFPVSGVWFGSSAESSVQFVAEGEGIVGDCAVSDHVGAGGTDDALDAMVDAAVRFPSCASPIFGASARRNEIGQLVLEIESIPGPHNTSEFTTSGGWANWNEQPHGGGYKMRSPITSGTKIAVKIVDATHGTIDLTFYNEDDSFESRTFNINPGKTYFAAASNAWFYVGLEGGGGDGDTLYAGIPLTEINVDSVTKSWVVLSGNEFSTSLRWNTKYSIYTDDFGFNQSETSITDPRLVFPHYVNGGNPLIDSADCALITEPLVAYGVAGTKSSSAIIGQLYDAVVITKSFDLDTEETFDGRTWRCISSQVGGGFSPDCSLWIAVT